jgi:DNA-binding MarR family transcriptional regulator
MQLPDLEKTLTPWIGKTAKLMSIYITDKFKTHGIDLTKEQMLLLKCLHEEDGQVQNSLAEITERDKASLARLVSTMEKKNMVARIPGTGDRRINRIFLTRDGRKIFEATLPVIAEIMNGLQQGISEEEINAAIETLKKVQKNLTI